MIQSRRTKHERAAIKELYTPRFVFCKRWLEHQRIKRYCGGLMSNILWYSATGKSEAYKRTVLTGNEVLLCVRGTTGIVALATDELKGCNVNREIVPLYFGDDVDRLFVYYQLQAPFIQEAIEEKTMGSALKQINIKDLRALKLRIPPLAEQNA